MKIIRWLIIAIFLAEGITKLLGFGFQVDNFAKWMYPAWFMYVIGIFETSGAIGLMMPKTRLYANIGLLGIMIGAFYTHISRHEPVQMMGLAIITTILLLIHLRTQRRMENQAVAV